MTRQEEEWRTERGRLEENVRSIHEKNTEIENSLKVTKHCFEVHYFFDYRNNKKRFGSSCMVINQVVNGA